MQTAPVVKVLNQCRKFSHFFKHQESSSPEAQQTRRLANNTHNGCFQKYGVLHYKEDLNIFTSNVLIWRILVDRNNMVIELPSATANHLLPNPHPSMGLKYPCFLFDAYKYKPRQSIVP